MKIAKASILLLLGTASISASVTKTTTTLSSLPNPSTYGQAVTLSAAVTSKLGAPPNGESVAFVQGKNVIGTGALSGGTATFATSTLAGGTVTITAVYSGDANFGGSTSNAVKQVVIPATTMTTLTSSQNPSNVGQPVTFTASVSSSEFSGTVPGEVTFHNGSTTLGTVVLSGGVANYTTAGLAVGTAVITAAYYRGSKSFSTSTSGAVDQTVGAGTFTNSTMIWDGVTRYYGVFLPTALFSSPPMLLMLHGTWYTPDGGADSLAHGMSRDGTGAGKNSPTNMVLSWFNQLPPGIRARNGGTGTRISWMERFRRPSLGRVLNHRQQVALTMQVSCDS